MILNPLQRIRVLKSKKKFKPGSLGYFVAQDSINGFNGWDMCIVFTKIGKNGKRRVEPGLIRPYMVDHGTMKDVDRRIINITKVREKVEPARYESKTEIGDTKIEPFPMDSKNLLNLPDEEFTAYIVALSMFIYKMTYSEVARNLHRIPPIKSKDFVGSNFSLEMLGPGWLGYHILYGIQYDEHTRRAQADRKNFESLYNLQISTVGRKQGLLDKLHKGLAMAKDPTKEYRTITENAFRHNATKINNVLSYYRKHKEELKQIEEEHNPWGPVRLREDIEIRQKQYVKVR